MATKKQAADKAQPANSNLDFASVASEVVEASVNREALAGGYVTRYADIADRYGLTGRTKDGTLAEAEAVEAVIAKLPADWNASKRSRFRAICYFSKEEVADAHQRIVSANVSGGNAIADTLVVLNKARNDHKFSVSAAATKLIKAKKKAATDAAEKAAKLKELKPHERRAESIHAIAAALADRDLGDDSAIKNAQAAAVTAIGELAVAIKEHGGKKVPAPKASPTKAKNKAAEKAAVTEAGDVMGTIMQQLEMQGNALTMLMQKLS